MAMKRSRAEGEIDCITMANCLMLLSRAGEAASMTHSPRRTFECKTCNRQFPSFQALGGHRASHKKPRLMGEDPHQTQLQSSQMKPKTHECSICGLEFAIGQALGGHMRRHRAALSGALSLSLTSRPVTSQVPVVKKSQSKRVLLLDLDLNLTPIENELEIKLGKLSPVVNCFI